MKISDKIWEPLVALMTALSQDKRVYKGRRSKLASIIEQAPIRGCTTQAEESEIMGAIEGFLILTSVFNE
jgi:hypothetical protein